jgi:hypothetical protein
MHPITIGNAIAVAAALLSIAGVLIAIIIANQKGKQAKLDFMRSALERGAPLDPELVDKIMYPGRAAASKRALPPGKGALVAAIVVIAFGVGYAVLAWFIALIAPSARFPMLGVAGLMICVGIGLVVVSKALRSGYSVTDPKE